MPYFSNLQLRQISGTEIDTVTSGTLLVENPSDLTGAVPATYSILFDPVSGSYYFNLDENLGNEDPYKFTVDIEYTLADGTECQRTFIFFDTVINDDAAYTEGYTIGFDS